MGWLVALIEFVASAALGFFGVEITRVAPAEEVTSKTYIVEYIETAETDYWRPVSAPVFSSDIPCPQNAVLPQPEPVDEPVFLIEI
ncbi:MAG: hypothetical protein CMF74_06610 [Maricaulis sp.]|jgi:hypothetical protein|nr:hypothetical protein [Maricaulis sp.]HAQ34081.1 hypothetical protein [Alphaproteobacteria bacterium]HAV50499.1 hypothetical protein [Brevundimonas sp.]